ncbi:nitrogenase iron-molybdenum cofactor biosynthesis protein NifE [Candidatus Methylospira mobilis]|uniref:Nitrogenase iron-molybdenum cofactor biosynthesis protein NifE n=1 Tax=Candidatus Methylospira mobilis TaxID=1808979 RepID=A0A5Q0BDB5_9GAMM|nr:nitrogenase iron-molybdenum cofactor biosynthesis protein NifE [Candidatus Methylospira mobilis]QFY41519.1 nitrogenase iron-molybdenum cofactor biosynthesis protein NifE [Candidatus Methylospira mobilis]WNV05245.1 nitrogenase iron-molybdenum cofactor biosynthesis protein NifE [Candidatus Methylospira mobilis]
MNQNEIQALLDEPACSHNKGAKTGCAKARPGAAQGGCAFDGAQIALLPIADAVHIVHGPIGCAGSSWDARGTRSSGPALYRIGMTTDLSDVDVIMGGGEKRLFHAVKQAIETYRPAAVFIYNTCVTALQGDDIAALGKAAAQRWGVPVVPVDCAGFYGSKSLGNRIAGETLYKHVIGTREPDPVPVSARRPGIETHDVNLIGEYNIAGEFWHVAPLFDELGLRILCTLSGDSRFQDVQTMHRAEVNMVVCSKAMLNVARKLQDDFGTPFFEGSFYGIADTSRALRDFAGRLNDPGLSERTERLISREEAKADAALKPWRARLRGKRALIFSGGVKSWSVVSALQDLGMTVVATGTEKSTEEDRARIRELMGTDARMIDDNDQATLMATCKEYEADILIAGGRYLYPALKTCIPFLDINHERDFGYAGYAGMQELARQLAASIDSPVWPQVRKTPSWSRQHIAASIAA